MQPLAFLVFLSSLTLFILQIVTHEVSTSSNQKYHSNYSILFPHPSLEQLKIFLLAQVEEGNAGIM